MMRLCLSPRPKKAGPAEPIPILRKNQKEVGDNQCFSDVPKDVAERPLLWLGRLTRQLHMRILFYRRRNALLLIYCFHSATWGLTILYLRQSINTLPIRTQLGGFWKSKDVFPYITVE